MSASHLSMLAIAFNALALTCGACACVSGATSSPKTSNPRVRSSSAATFETPSYSLANASRLAAPRSWPPTSAAPCSRPRHRQRRFERQRQGRKSSRQKRQEARQGRQTRRRLGLRAFAQLLLQDQKRGVSPRTRRFPILPAVGEGVGASEQRGGRCPSDWSPPEPLSLPPGGRHVARLLPWRFAASGPHTKAVRDVNF